MTYPREGSTSDRYAPAWATALLVIVAIVCLVIGVIYIVEPAKSLPSFFPGYTAGLARHHAKHGIAALILGLALLAVGWISTGSRSRPVA
jgi:amino acid permease